ncbi:uncharacterized protein LOC141909875 [Tubulanus polymorphus]|uniref:uncharacterized protein LOC141909875 n=1 Tax=Tubulanus polymorphus TaxID=672921 RepID=UPI003DA1DF99
MMDDFIRSLFMSGHQYSDIVNLIYLDCGRTMSVRQLKRHLKRMGLKRNKNYSFEDVVHAVSSELSGSGSCLGYRSMTDRLRHRYGIKTPRSLVARVLRELDEEGVADRSNGVLRRRRYSNKGPNYLIHVDGYDKLKPYGFCIHGAMDGFSRRILWLKVASTNNDPSVIGYYFTDYIKQIAGVPRCIRIDAGTENVLLCEIQRSFRADDNDDMAGDMSVLIGKSTSNQRIERFWRTLRNSVGQFWMNMFKDMSDTGIFSNADAVHVETIRFCFHQLIEQDLEDFRNEWNSHRIRRQRNCDVPCSKPDLLYFAPELFGTTDHKIEINYEDVIDVQAEFCKQPNDRGSSEPDFPTMCDNIMAVNGFSLPQSADEAYDLYIQLLGQF